MECYEYNTCGLYYKHVMTVNDDSSVINKWSFKLIDGARVIIYDRNRLIIQAHGYTARVDKTVKSWLSIVFKFRASRAICTFWHLTNVSLFGPSSLHTTTLGSSLIIGTCGRSYKNFYSRERKELYRINQIYC